MDNLLFEFTERTPEINFNCVTGSFLISGNSIPEDCLVFYKEIFNWLDEYIKNPRPETVLELRMKFFNTSTSKCLFTIFRKIEELKINGNEASINWYYQLEDTDMYESGLDFQQMIKVPFKIEKL
tara:strand:- start:886 stop:1260 length:375 start_codon:yes stop_codon:yes gene_type:complete